MTDLEHAHGQACYYRDQYRNASLAMLRIMDVAGGKVSGLCTIGRKGFRLMEDTHREMMSVLARYELWNTRAITLRDAAERKVS